MYVQDCLRFMLRRLLTSMTWRLNSLLVRGVHTRRESRQVAWLQYRWWAGVPYRQPVCMAVTAFVQGWFVIGEKGVDHMRHASLRTEMSDPAPITLPNIFVYYELSDDSRTRPQPVVTVTCRSWAVHTPSWLVCYELCLDLKHNLCQYSWVIL